MFHPDDLQDILPTYLSAMQTGSDFRSKYRIKRRDGCLRWHACRGAPVRDPQGNIQSWMCSVSDVHEDTEARHDALLVKERTKAVLEGSGGSASDCGGGGAHKA
jgi:PAS domain S-box-containing protein